MPAQKRSSEASGEEDDPMAAELQEGRQSPEQNRHDDSDGSLSSESDGKKDEYVTVKLGEIRKEVQCPICLGIIKQTRTVMECLHRFCSKCIAKSMRLGNNECPACRTHCASRRSLRDDPNYDALIAALYPDIERFEEEEDDFSEEEKARNKQVQANIALTIRRQSEALGRKRAKSTAAVFSRRSHGSFRNLRGKRNQRNSVENQGSDENEETNRVDGNKSSSSVEERTEKRLKRGRRSRAEIDGNDSEATRETVLASLALVGSRERLAWGKGGMRSHTRHGSNSNGNGKNSRNNRISKLVDYLRSSGENSDEYHINLILVSLDDKVTPSLQQPYLSCTRSLSVKHLSEYVASQTALKADEVEIHTLKLPNENSIPSTLMSEKLMKSAVSECKETVRVLPEQQTLADLKPDGLTSGYLILAYQKKST